MKLPSFDGPALALDVLKIAGESKTTCKLLEDSIVHAKHYFKPEIVCTDVQAGATKKGMVNGLAINEISEPLKFSPAFPRRFSLRTASRSFWASRQGPALGSLSVFYCPGIHGLF
jgi:hypothetical protein